MTLSKEEKRGLAEAKELYADMDRLQGRVCEILDPIYKKVAAIEDPVEFRKLMEMFPQGIHRSELRVVLYDLIHHGS